MTKNEKNEKIKVSTDINQIKNDQKWEVWIWRVLGFVKQDTNFIDNI